MHPADHARTSVRLWGGKVEDYLQVHNWFDATKEHFADFRHRALRHHSEGIFECERLFGVSFVNSDGRMSKHELETLLEATCASLTA